MTMIDNRRKAKTMGRTLLVLASEHQAALKILADKRDISMSECVRSLIEDDMVEQFGHNWRDRVEVSDDAGRKISPN